MLACFSIYFAAFLYALVGAPGSGKTSIITELEKKGESVIYDPTSDFVITKVRSGILEPWKQAKFNLDILQLQLETEKQWLSQEGRVFINRGILDVYTFAMYYKLAGTQVLASINKILNQIDLNQHYKAIFFIMPYDGDFSPFTEERDFSENEYEAARLELATYSVYCKHKNFIVVPGGLTPEDRADFILKKVEKIEQKEYRNGKQSIPLVPN